MTATPNDRAFRQFQVRNVELTGVPLGSGTYGNVEEAVIAGAKCAARTINEGAFPPADTVKIRQANVTAGCVRWSHLRHPNVVQFLGVLERDSPIPALLMELCVTDLHKFLKSPLTIPLSLKISILHDIASGLAYLHGQVPAIVHGRLSAKKVLLDSGAVAKISVDIGVTVLPQKLDLSPYMPPEVTGRECPRNETIDVFSFAIIAIFTIIEDLPDRILPPTYTDESNRLVARSEVERRANDVEKISRHSHSLSQLITTCLSNQPEARPSLEEILELLRQAGIMNPDPFQEKTKAQLVHEMAALSQGHLQMKEEFEHHVKELRDQIHGLLQGMRKQREMLPRNEDEDLGQDVVNEQEIAYIVNFLEGIRASDLGIALGVSVSSMDIIDADHLGKHDESTKRVLVLKEWVRNCDSPTWSGLLEALSTIGQQRMADIISRDKGMNIAFRGIHFKVF